MSTFKIEDTDSKQPMILTHFFNWLRTNGSADGHTIKDKQNYLTEQGFIYGEDKLSHDDLQSLKAIHKYFYGLKREGALPALFDKPIYVSGHDPDVIQGDL